MNNLQPAENANPVNQMLIDDVTELLNSGFADSDFLELATRLWFGVIDPENPDDVYDNYPELTQHIMETHFISGKQEEFAAECLNRFVWKDKNMFAD